MNIFLLSVEFPLGFSLGDNITHSLFINIFILPSFLKPIFIGNRIHNWQFGVFLFVCMFGILEIVFYC